MPKFSSSLGCADAPYIYNAETTTYSVPMGPKSDHAVNLRRANAVGTVTIAEGAPGATDIQFEMTLRTNDKALLDSVAFTVPTQDEIEEGLARSEVTLSTPTTSGSTCMRYDVVVRVPHSLKKLAVMTGGSSVAQVQFAPEAQVALDELYVTMYGLASDNMLLPHANVRAKKLSLEMTNGWLVGAASIVESTSIKTQNGAANTHVEVFPVAVDVDGTTPPVATLDTATGTGRTDIFYINDLGAPHRPISSTHISSRNGDLYLTYKKAEFNGKLDVQAKSFTATGVQNMFSKNGTSPWVGNAEGGDSLVAHSNNGWVGLYF